MRLVIAAAVTFLCLSAGDARAGGGAFFPATSNASVTDHRMVFKIGTNETILWDQIRYTGAPSELAWVLPVHAGAELQLSHDEFIATLDKATQPEVAVTGPTCDTGGGCSHDDDELATLGSGGDDGSVSILSEQTVGPYDVLTLHANAGQSIGDYLTSNGFAIPDASKAILDAYVNEGFDFIALRLRPGQGVQAMQPVRVVTPGTDPTLPLRMVGAGAAPNVGITLWVIAEGRYQAANFPNALVDDSQLKLTADGGTTFNDVEAALFAQNGRRTWVTEFAGLNFSEIGLATLTTTYQTSCQGQEVQLACVADAGVDGGDDGGSNAHDLPNDAGTDTDADAAADADAGEDAGEDAGSEPDASVDEDAAVPVDAGPCIQTVAACMQYDDFDVALRGLAADNTWLTRLHANLPASALTVDLQLAAEPTQENVLPDHTITQGSCDDGGCESTPASRSAMGSYALAGITAAILAALARRRRYSGRR